MSNIYDSHSMLYNEKATCEKGLKEEKIKVCIDRKFSYMQLFGGTNLY